MATKLTDRQKEEIQTFFQQLDKDNDGFIDAKEMGKLLRVLGQNPTSTELKKIENKCDKPLDWDSTISLIEEIGLKSQEEEEEELRLAFRAIDRDGSGTISKDELKRYLCLLGERMTEEEVDEIMTLSDKDGDGVINYEEFISVMAAYIM